MVLEVKRADGRVRDMSESMTIVPRGQKNRILSCDTTDCGLQGHRSIPDDIFVSTLDSFCVMETECFFHLVNTTIART
jgi:hypothetical protein